MLRSPPLERDAPSIPDHTLLRRIGRGAYGEVWLARNVVGTLRAVKVGWREDFAEAHPFEREFNGIQKFEPVSRAHAGLVDILQIGRNDAEGYFYCVMELADPVGGQRSGNENQELEVGRRTVDGTDPNCGTPTDSTPNSYLPTPLLTPDSYIPRTLRSDLRARGRLPVEECVIIGLALTDALMHLHAAGLVHRDIKPSNIIFVDGMPKLADIGLVAAMDDARSFVGTEGFIPPEGPGMVTADLFSLGRVLYETGMGWRLRCVGGDRRHTSASR